MTIPNRERTGTAAKVRRRFAPFIWLVLLFAFLVKPGSPQNGQSMQNPLAAQSSQAAQRSQMLDYPGEPGGAFDPMMQERRIKMLNSERHKQMVSDADKLVKLATELNDEIAHSNPGALTPEQMRKVAEIEKLAHGVRDKMTMTISPPPVTLFPIGGTQ